MYSHGVQWADATPPEQAGMVEAKFHFGMLSVFHAYCFGPAAWIPEEDGADPYNKATELYHHAHSTWDKMIFCLDGLKTDMEENARPALSDNPAQKFRCEVSLKVHFDGVLNYFSVLADDVGKIVRYVIKEDWTDPDDKSSFNSTKNSILKVPTSPLWVLFNELDPPDKNESGFPLTWYKAMLKPTRGLRQRRIHYSDDIVPQVFGSRKPGGSGHENIRTELFHYVNNGGMTMVTEKFSRVFRGYFFWLNMLQEELVKILKQRFPTWEYGSINTAVTMPYLPMYPKDMAPKGEYLFLPVIR